MIKATALVNESFGLAQNVMGLQHARFDLRDVENFNCGFAEMAACVAEELPAVLTRDTQENTRFVRRALVKAIDHLKTDSPAQDKKTAFGTGRRCRHRA